MIDLKHADCLSAMPDIADGSIDLVLSDLPYGTTNCKWDSIIPFDLMWKQINRLIKPNTAIIFTASQPFTSALIQSNKKDFRYSLVWEKSIPTGFLNAKKMPLRAHEDILVFYKKLPVYNPQMKKIEGKNRIRRSVRPEKHPDRTYGSSFNKPTTRVETHRYPRSVISGFYDKSRFRSNKKDQVYRHPTKKPVTLMEYLIKTYSNEGDTILDFTMGSGTTGVACKNTNRKFIGIEKDREYFSMAKSRIEAHPAGEAP